MTRAERFCTCNVCVSLCVCVCVSRTSGPYCTARLHTELHAGTALIHSCNTIVFWTLYSHSRLSIVAVLDEGVLFCNSFFFCHLHHEEVEFQRHKLMECERIFK